MDLTPDDVRDVLHALDSSGLDELHLEMADLTLTVRREGASGWTAEQQVLRRPVPFASSPPAGRAGEPKRPHCAPVVSSPSPSRGETPTGAGTPRAPARHRRPGPCHV